MGCGRWVGGVLGTVALLILIGGCGAVQPLPEMFEVATTAASSVEAEAGTGPSGLANSTWSLVRAADPSAPDDDPEPPPGPYGGILSGEGLARPPVGERIFLVEFGPNGELVEARENRFFLPQFYGSTVPIGEEWIGTSLPGVVFQSASYGMQEGDHYGIAVVVHVRFANFFLGRAILYSWGDIAGDEITGQFGYLLDFTDGVVSFLGTVADQYPVTGDRVDGDASE